jgi:hypothetical protein
VSTCFVGLPPAASYDAYYREILVRAVLRAGLDPVHADHLDKHGAIAEQIRAGVSDAAICVVDLTGRSGAALYVLGLAHGIAKPVIVLVQNPDDLPYDLKLGHYILYRPGTAHWEDMLSLQLRTAIREGLRA